MMENRHKKTATKKSPTKKKGSVADSWVEGYWPFTDAVWKDFDFLVCDYGFNAPEVKRQRQGSSSGVSRRWPGRGGGRSGDTSWGGL
jgi:hypothetical protein